MAGYSNGAFMASALACSDARTVAAVAPVAGIEADAGCRPSRRVPVIAFHGTADPSSPTRVASDRRRGTSRPTDGSRGYLIGSDVTSKSNRGHRAERPPRPGGGGPVGCQERLFEDADESEGDQGCDVDHVTTVLMTPRSSSIGRTAPATSGPEAR